jgi:hypothetical protein
LKCIKLAECVQDVQRLLKRVVEEAYAEDSAEGFFPALYIEETEDLLRAARQGVFDEPKRLEETVVAFANRYFLARGQYRLGLDPSRVWALSFNAATRDTLLLVQHLLLGANAHINLDLAPTVAETGLCGRDYERVNDILALGVERIQERINQVSPLFALLDRVFWSADEFAVIFGIRALRARAEEIAARLLRAPGDERERVLAEVDRDAESFGRQLLRPRVAGRLLLPALRAEEKWISPRRMIERLLSPQ